MLTYFALVLTSLAAVIGSPWWVALGAGAAISLVSIWEQQKLRARFAAVGATDVLTTSALAALATGCIGALGAFMIGRVVGLLVMGA
jgi:hypothetical protein